MPMLEHLKESPRGLFRDRLIDPSGNIIWEKDWRSNTIVADCRRLLAAFVHGASTTMGIQGLLVGTGSDAWDTGGPPAPSGSETQLLDSNPFLVGSANIQLDYLHGNTVSATPTNRLQVVATLGPGIPSWPDGNHVTGNLREFGLVADLNGTPVLINYVTHSVIAKDTTSTLERTIWLVF